MAERAIAAMKPAKATEVTPADRNRAFSLIADRKRAEIVDMAGIAEIASGARVSMEPKNALEEMLIDELVAAHDAGLRLLHQGSLAPNAESMCRLVHAAGKMLRTFQEGVLVLHRIRHRPEQRIVVQHVHADQAVIAGNIGAGG